MTDRLLERPPSTPFRATHVPRSFDRVLILGVFAAALFVAFLSAETPEWFAWVLLADLWLLGYHHVIATFTRFTGPSANVPRRALMLVGLPPFVLAGTVALAAFAGIEAVVTLYFHWQWYHYARQSWGVSRFLRGKTSAKPEAQPWLAQAAFWATPVIGLLFRASEGHRNFLYMPVRMLPVPGVLVAVAAIAGGAIIAMHAWRELRAFSAQNTSAFDYWTYLATHHAVFLIAYVGVSDLNWGWLVVNVWHNAQYLLFVWAFNVNRCARSADSAHWFVRLCQPRNIAFYFLGTLALTTIVYQSLLRAVGWFDVTMATVALVVVFQTANFHHYIVDSMIWKRPRGKLAAPRAQHA